MAYSLPSRSSLRKLPILAVYSVASLFSRLCQRLLPLPSLRLPGTCPMKLQIRDLRRYCPQEQIELITLLDTILLNTAASCADLPDVDEADNQGSVILRTRTSTERQQKLKKLSSLHNDVVHRGHTVNSVYFPSIQPTPRCCQCT